MKQKIIQEEIDTNLINQIKASLEDLKHNRIKKYKF